MDPYQKIEGISKVGFIGFYGVFLGLIALGNPPFPAQGHTHLWHCFRLKSGMASKAAKRLGDFLQTE